MKKVFEGLELVVALAVAGCSSGSSGGSASPDGGTGADGAMGGPDGSAGTDGAPAADGGVAPDAPASAEGGAPLPSTECAAWANAQCTYDANCNPSGLQTDFGGSMSECVSEFGVFCAIYEQSQGTGWTTSAITACVTSLQNNMACKRGVPTASSPCQFAGSGAPGSACGDRYQCASLGCSVPQGTACGTCTQTASVGESCDGTTGATCAIGLTCTAKGACATLVGSGAACDAANVCISGFDCVRASADAGAGGTCQASVATLGAACDRNSIGAPRCDGALSLYCDGTGHCASVTFAAAGSPCGAADGGTSDVLCTNGAACVSGSCVASLAPGDSCTGMSPYCGFNTNCVAGTCQYTNAANCH
jgi:hypothetical protein